MNVELTWTGRKRDARYHVMEQGDGAAWFVELRVTAPPDKRRLKVTPTCHTASWPRREIVWNGADPNQQLQPDPDDPTKLLAAMTIFPHELGIARTTVRARVLTFTAEDMLAQTKVRVDTLVIPRRQTLVARWFALALAAPIVFLAWMFATVQGDGAAQWIVLSRLARAATPCVPGLLAAYSINRYGLRWMGLLERVRYGALTLALFAAGAAVAPRWLLDRVRDADGAWSTRWHEAASASFVAVPGDEDVQPYSSLLRHFSARDPWRRLAEEFGFLPQPGSGQQHVKVSYDAATPAAAEETYPELDVEQAEQLELSWSRESAHEAPARYWRIEVKTAKNEAPPRVPIPQRLDDKLVVVVNGDALACRDTSADHRHRRALLRSFPRSGSLTALRRLTLLDASGYEAMWTAGDAGASGPIWLCVPKRGGEQTFTLELARSPVDSALDLSGLDAARLSVIFGGDGTLVCMGCAGTKLVRLDARRSITRLTARYAHARSDWQPAAATTAAWIYQGEAGERPSLCAKEGSKLKTVWRDGSRIAWSRVSDNTLQEGAPCEP